jgi:hypothetical protein
LFGFGAAADPEQAVEVDACSGGGLWVERVRHVDPCTDTVVLCQTREEREGQRCPTGALGTGELGEGADRETTLESVIESRDAGGSCGTDDPRWWSERGRDPVSEGGFDLLAEVGSGRHAAVLSPYIRLSDKEGASVDLHRQRWNG